MANKYAVLAYVLLAIFVVGAALTSYNTYLSDTATHTLNTKIYKITQSSDPVFYATGFSAFPLEFSVSVWNTYKSGQELESPTNCGFEISLLDTTINESVDMFKFEGCSDAATTFRYKSGSTSTIVQAYLRVFSEHLPQIPAGSYVFAYNYAYTTNKLGTIYNTTLIVYEDGSYTYRTGLMATGWGSSGVASSPLPAPTLSIFTMLLVIGYSQKRRVSRS